MRIGAYAVERDYSHYVAYAAKTVFAVVGTATKGPVGVATVCTSAQDLVNKFGMLKTDCYALYAGQYFLSQSSKLYFVRAASDSVAASTALIAGKNATSVTLEDARTLQAIEPGTHFDDYTVIVTATADKYDIVVKNKSQVTVETLKGLDIDDLVGTFNQSNYFRISAANLAATELTAGTYTFTGGNDGISDIDAADYINAAQVLSPDTVDMNLFAVPGISEASVISAMLTLAETRGDCLYLVDPPEGLTRDGVIAWHNGAGENWEHSVFNSSYGALYYDWISIYDSVNKTKVLVPPSVVVAATIAYSDRTSELWYAPAGLQRGIVRGALDSATKLSRPDTELLYTGDNSINSIYDDPQVGLVLWGQKTLLRENTALNRINVRRLLNYLKRVIVAACDSLTFEPNDRITWNSFEMKIIPTLQNIQQKRGIYEYRVVKGETIVSTEDIDNYRMPCMVMIRPMKAAEEIPIHFVITSAGADFNEVLNANGVVTDNL